MWATLSPVQLSDTFRVFVMAGILSGREFFIDIEDSSLEEYRMSFIIVSAGENDIREAVQDVIAGRAVTATRAGYQQNNFTPVGGVPPATAQIEQFWSLQYTDNVTGFPNSYLIPTPDLSLLIPGTDVIDITTPGTVGKALKDTVEQRCLSIDQNALTVNKVQFVVV